MLFLSPDEAPATGNSHLANIPVVHEEREPAPEKVEREDDHKKEKSVLQAKLTKLAIQIGYAGKSLGIGFRLYTGTQVYSIFTSLIHLVRDFFRIENRQYRCNINLNH